MSGACDCSIPEGGGFGTMPFGTGPCGTGFTSSSLALLAVRLIAANLAVVGYSGDPGLADPGDTTGPLFPNNWHLTAIDPELQERLVQFVALVPDELTLATYTDDYPQLRTVALPFFLVWFDGNPTPGGHYRLTLTLPDTPLLAGCDCTEFVGLTLRPDTIQTDARDGDRIQDLANPAVGRDSLLLPPQVATYQLTDTGDLGLDKSEEASLRKRILRRVTVAAGGFFHLPNYGAGQKLKGKLTVDAVDRLRSRIRAQVLQEPDVVDVKVTVRLATGSTSALVADIVAVPNGGDPVSLTVPIQIP